MTLGMMIKKARSEKSLKKVSSLMRKDHRVSSSAIFEYETGKSFPSLLVLRELCRVLGVDYDVARELRSSGMVLKKKAFRDYFNEARSDKKITYDVLQEKMGISKSGIHSYSTGRNLPKKRQLKSLCAIFGWEYQEMAEMVEKELLKKSRKLSSLIRIASGVSQKQALLVLEKTCNGHARIDFNGEECDIYRFAVKCAVCGVNHFRGDECKNH